MIQRAARFDGNIALLHNGRRLDNDDCGREDRQDRARDAIARVEQIVYRGNTLHDIAENMPRFQCRLLSKSYQLDK